MELDLARKIAARYLQIADALDDVADLSMKIEDEDARIEFRRGLGELMGYADLYLRKYLQDQHPEVLVGLTRLPDK